MDAEKLKAVVEAHGKWVHGEGGVRADLSDADLSGASLSRANLSGASMSGANLSRASLSGADLIGADLSGASLSGADLSGASLSGAYLSGADLSRANLSRADLIGASLSGADLSGADLSGANLSRAYLSGAGLSRANLSGATAAHNTYIITACVTNYQMAAFIHKDSVRITAGCRRGLTIAEARANWSPERMDKWTEKTPEYGLRQLAMLDFLEAQARLLGWPVDGVAP